MTMVRHHHQDSSQLSLALFGGSGGAQGAPKPPQQMRNSTSQIDQIPRQSNYDANSMSLRERRQREWESNSMSLAGGFWGQREKNTPPTDKPPDNSRQVSAYHHPFDKPTQNSSQNQSYQQHPQRMQLQPYQESPQYQSPMAHHVPYQQGYFTGDTLGGAQTPMSPNNMYPFTIPVGMPNAGYNNGAPVYFIMAPPNGVSPQLLPDMLKHISTNPPQSSQQLILESVSSASSVGSRWGAPSPDPQRSISRDPNKSLSRAKWGEKGVGVGHLWDPEVSVKIPSAAGSAGSVPPNWAEQNEGARHAGGHVPEERTHARGQAVVLDAQERADRQRKQRQAQETQRIIQQQLDEKKRQQEEEIERERKDAAIWEEKLKEQRERERKEIEEEQKKKRDKEEAEERRQERLREAIQEAAIKAKREKEEARFGRSKTLPSEDNQLKIEQPETSKSLTATPRNGALESARPEKKEVISTSRTEKEAVEETSKEKVTREDKEKEILSKINLPDLVSSAQLGSLDQAQKMAILRALGIAPDFLFASGAFEKSTFMSLLGQSYANNVPVIKEDGGEYIRNVVLTPTKFRRARDCGIQCDDVLSDGYEEERGSRSRRFNRRQKTKSVRESSLSSPDKKPQWGRHKSDRPYRKQSDKDPYSSRKIRRRPTRSVSISGRDNGSNTEESDPQQTGEPRRRRKTWNESRQESLSSDFSRSPSPKSRKGSKISFKGPPPIKPPLTPLVSNYNSEKLADAASMQSFKIAPSPNSAFTIYKGRDEAKDVDAVGGAGEAERTDNVAKQAEESTVSQSFQNISQVHDDDADVTVAPAKFRTDSPPVPALKGGSSFDIPEYPEGADPEEIINRPIRRRSSNFKSKIKTKSRNPNPKLESILDSEYKKSESNPELHMLANSVDHTISQSNSSPNFDHLQTTSNSTSNSKRSPRPPAVRKSRKSSLPVIYTPDESAEIFDIPISEVNGKSRKKTLERRASLTGCPRTEGEQVPKINSITRPSSKTSHTSSTPRRLPPMPCSPSQICRDSAGSPPVPAIQQKMLENSLNGRSIETSLNGRSIETALNGRSIETLSLLESSRNYEKITPVEVTTPRIRTGMSNVHPSSSSPTSISTGNDSSSEMPLKTGRRRKKESADSGVSEMMSRPDSTSSLIEEQLGTGGMNSLLSSQSSIYRRPRDLTAPPPDDPEQYVVLKSLSSVRQNFWRKSQDLSMNGGTDNGY